MRRGAETASHGEPCGQLAPPTIRCHSRMHGERGDQPNQEKGDAATHQDRSAMAMSDRGEPTRGPRSASRVRSARAAGRLIRRVIGADLQHGRRQRSTPPKRRSRRGKFLDRRRRAARSKSGQWIGRNTNSAIGRLPHQEIGETLLARGADDEIGIRNAGRIEMAAITSGVDSRRDQAYRSATFARARAPPPRSPAGCHN